ncbi:MAG: FAD-dependent thymidylate synthase, partial [Acidimicrobiia bacterium]|nr:FAD-dependent thymidylate synthase [Acidimicrobiia bacterium]
ADDRIVDLSKAEQLYQRVFVEYGDDSVAQLGGTHLACEQASNILTKVLEWGRLAAYLEQSTRYIFYDTTVDGRYRYRVPPELEEAPLGVEYIAHQNWMFDTYSALVRNMKEVYEQRFPRQPSDPPVVYNSTIRAKACDTARGLLTAATTSNVGIYASGQAYEMALVRMAAHPLAEVREYGDMMLGELRKVIPSFLTRVDKADRGRRWSEYLADVAERLDAHGALLGTEPETGPSVRLTDFDPEAETKLVAAALYAHSEQSDEKLRRIAAQMSAEERAEVIADLIGDRENRRHKPGRPMETTSYRFDVVCDFGAFRDLQRHRLMTIEWQRLTTRLGFDVPPDIVAAGHESVWQEAMERSSNIYERLRQRHGADVAQYVVPFAANIRFVMEMNARQAYHLIELRSQPAGHPAYRRVAHRMHQLIREEAGHTAIAGGMTFVDHGDVDLERLEAERAAERRRASRAQA